MVPVCALETIYLWTIYLIVIIVTMIVSIIMKVKLKAMSVSHNSTVVYFIIICILMWVV